jgi:hypothetical protein
MKFLITTILFTSLSTMAAVKLDIKAKWISKDGLKTSEQIINTELGEQFVIENGNGLKLKLTANHPTNTDHLGMMANEAIEVEGQVLDKVNNLSEVIARPRVVTEMGKAATITIKNNQGEILELEVLPQSM